jgi:hypothetical protein
MPHSTDVIVPSSSRNKTDMNARRFFRGGSLIGVAREAVVAHGR